MASYTLRDIDDKLWREVKTECARRGISIKAFLIDKLKQLVTQSKELGKRERKAGL